MPSTFSQIYIQIVFAVRNRDAMIDASWEDRLFQYITGIIKNKGQKLIVKNDLEYQFAKLNFNENIKIIRKY